MRTGLRHNRRAGRGTIGLPFPLRSVKRRVVRAIASQGTMTMADEITYDDFAKLELRVARVLEARPHPNAERLLLLQVDLGDQQKQIVAGIRQHYTPEQLTGKLIVVVNNLAPAILRGETSNGMLLAATSGEKVIVLTPDDPDCVPGAKVK
ncbi:MAG: methionine--tRNA ligase subunit beta [Isosphaeraceae bacterium]